MNNDLSYYSNLREEILYLVPYQASNILDIGCATGNFGKSIKQRQKAHVTGIEINQKIAQIAKQNIDDVYIGNVESQVLLLNDNSYDCIVLADVLEHLKNPEQILTQLSKKITDQGLFLISIPNFSNYHVIDKIIFGKFAYQSSGILDKTHIKFFTKSSIIDMLNNIGLEIQSFDYAINLVKINTDIIKAIENYGIDIKVFLQESEYSQYFVTAKKSTNYSLINKMFDNRINIVDRLFIALKNNLNTSILKNEILKHTDQENILSLYCLSYLFSINNEYKISISILEKILLTKKLNKDICAIFSYNLKKLNDLNLSTYFTNRIAIVSDYSPIKEILYNYPLN
ncbi:MAG: class I SAM-dependent methyltransferase [Candidatus Sericytochromatia bacterium]|nr:class I SAM-dependent methyltransferase [Candidatus Sericytochromatia bacterium]